MCKWQELSLVRSFVLQTTTGHVLKITWWLYSPGDIFSSWELQIEKGSGFVWSQDRIVRRRVATKTKSETLHGRHGSLLYRPCVLFIMDVLIAHKRFSVNTISPMNKRISEARLSAKSFLTLGGVFTYYDGIWINLQRLGDSIISAFWAAGCCSLSGWIFYGTR